MSIIESFTCSRPGAGTSMGRVCGYVATARSLLPCVREAWRGRSLHRGRAGGDGAFRVSLGVNGYIPGMICKKCLVSGRVQGVFYRGSAAQRAHELGVRGYARNLADGRVEVLACGEEEAVRTFVSWLWTGSSASQVTAVEVTDAPQDGAPAGFHTG